MADGDGIGPLVLMDQPEDGYCVQWGWVEYEPQGVRVSEEAARELLKPWVYDDDGRLNVAPGGPATVVHLKAKWGNPEASPDEERWIGCTASEPGARRFWQIDCTVFG